jgi:hypothetical protein
MKQFTLLGLCLSILIWCNSLEKADFSTDDLEGSQENILQWDIESLPNMGEIWEITEHSDGTQSIQLYISENEQEIISQWDIESLPNMGEIWEITEHSDGTQSIQLYISENE